MLTVIFALIGLGFVFTGFALLRLPAFAYALCTIVTAIGGFIIAIATLMIFTGGYL